MFAQRAPGALLFYYRAGENFAPGIFRTRKFRAGFISHNGLKIEREISHLPGLFTVQATVPGGPSLVKKPITRALHSDPKSKVCSFFFLEGYPESMLPINTICAEACPTLVVCAYTDI